ncbi:glycosyltransferase [Aromatoleum toluolicum]|uniref:Glycosyltransferase n=1 Tax=Aromatoleum toluolicum TaxID=90060 RepID=A0ABX1NBU9_9RHOO|nr:glycosyltransferase [Aromatoleum toluolicum]NMF96729.1 glycosyltransferase [Aromatoleum toluolicum]
MSGQKYSPTVSIVMPCFNAASHLQMSVGSVLAQTSGDWELIIVDDGSQDASWTELQRLAQDESRIRIFRQRNAGAAAARNHALREARGFYIAFLDADDTWHPEFLEVMEQALRNAGAHGLTYCGWQNITDNGSHTAPPFVPPDYEHGGKIEALLQGCRWPIHAALVSAEAIRESGGFDESLSSCMDYDLWLRLGATLPLVRVPRVLANYHHHQGDQITKNRARIALNHRRVQEKFLIANPGVRERLGTNRVRELTAGELLKRGYESYWKRDLLAARAIFRAVMKEGYGGLRDWKYLITALLPLGLHQALLGALSNDSADDARQRQDER